MATYTIEFRRLNEPIVGAEVTASGERIHGNTDANGRISATIGYSNPIAVQFYVTHNGTYACGSGPHLLQPDATTVINLL